MKRALKWIFGIAGAVVLLAVVFVVVVALTLDPGAYKTRIEKAVEAKTGRKLTLTGDLSLTFFPWLGVELGTFSLANPPGFGDAPFVKADKTAVQIKLLPLIGGDVLVRGVELSGLNLELIRKKDGTTNWDGLAGKTDEKSEAKPVAEDSSNEDAFIKSLFVGEVSVKSARVLWDDRQNGQRCEIANLNLTTGELSPGTPFDVALTMRFDNLAPALKGTLDLSSRMFIGQGGKAFNAEGLKLALDAGGGALPFSRAQIQLSGDASYSPENVKMSGLSLALKAQGGQLKEGGTLDADLSGNVNMDNAGQTIAVDGLALSATANLPDPALKAVLSLSSAVQANLKTSDARLAGLKMTVDASGAGIGLDASRIELGTDAAFNWETQLLTLAKLAIAASAEGKSIPGGPAKAELGGELSANLKRESLDLSGMRISAMGMSATGAVQGASILSSPSFSGSLNAPPFNLRDLLTKLGVSLDTADPTALTSVGVSTGYSASADAVSLRSLALALDGSKLAGDLSVSGFKRPIPALAFRITGDSLDADRYLPPASKAASGGSSGSSGKGTDGKDDKEVVPVDTLKNLQIDGSLTLGSFKINNLRMKDVHLAVKAAGGKLSVSPVKLAMYESQITGALSVDASGATPRSSVNYDLGTLNLRPFLKDLTGKESMGGLLKTRASLTASGAKLKDILAGLNGDFSMDLKDCDIDKADQLDSAVLLPLQAVGTTLGPLVKSLSALQNLNLGDSLPRLGGSEEKLASVAVQATAQNGQVVFKTLNVLYPYLRINGDGGTMNLGAMTLNYPFTAKIVKYGQGQSAEVSKESGGMTIPVLCKGPLKNPSCVPDPTAIIKGVLSQPINSPEDLLNNVGSMFGVGSDTKKTESTQSQTTTKSTDTQKSDTPQEPVKKMQNLLKGLFQRTARDVTDRGGRITALTHMRQVLDSLFRANGRMHRHLPASARIPRESGPFYLIGVSRSHAPLGFSLPEHMGGNRLHAHFPFRSNHWDTTRLGGRFIRGRDQKKS